MCTEKPLVNVKHGSESLDIMQVYNRMQEAHKVIAELVELLGDHRDADPDLNSEDYLDDLSDRTVDAIAKYGDINGY